MIYVSLPQRRLLRLPVAGLAVLLSACSGDKNSMLAPADSRITVSAPASFVVVNTPMDITIEVVQADGAPVPDGTEVLLTATRGDLLRLKLRTSGGLAVNKYLGTSDPGMVQFDAFSADARGTMTMAVASKPVGRVSLGSAPAILPHNGGQTELEATVLSDSGEPVVGAPVKFETSAGSVDPAEPVLTNDQGKASAKLKSSDAARVQARVDQVSSGELPIALESLIELNIVVSSTQPRVGQEVSFVVSTSEPDTVGSMTLEFGDGQETDFGDGTGNRTTSHTYSSAGNFNVRASFSAPGRTSVRHTIPLSVQEVSIPAPGGGGSGPISPPPTFGPSDPNVPFSLSSVGWLHTDVSGWAETSQISRVEFDLEGRNVKTICFPHSKAGRWPIIENGEGNVWVFGQIGGRWYAGTWDWLKKGQVCKTANGFYWGEYPHGIGHHVHKPPLETWAPRSGELVGIMVSTHARFGQQGIAERTNVYMTTWP